MELIGNVHTGDQLRDSEATQMGNSFQLDGLPGTWLNTNRGSCGIIRVIIAVKGPTLFVRAFGAGDSVPSDWGEVEVDQIYARSISSQVASGFTAWYDFDFSQVHLEANWNHGLLVLASFTSFKDGSKRSNYFSREFFHRELTRQQEN
jgi:hypothetical protein